MSVEFRSELRSGCIQFSGGNAMGCIQFSKGNATASLAFQGWAMSLQEDSGVFEGVKRALHGCDEAVRGLELLELAVTGARMDSLGIELPAVGSQDDLERGSYNDLAQVDEGEDDIPVPTPLIPVPAPILSLPLIPPIPDDDLPGSGPATHPEHEEDPG